MPTLRPPDVAAGEASPSWRRALCRLGALARGATVRLSAELRRPPRSAPARCSPPLPEGFGVVLDRSTRRTDGGSTLIGGTPATVLRLSAAGAAALDALAAGSTVPCSGAVNRLARRLVDRGLAHPRPPDRSPDPDVTVVIPVRDDPTGLAATLASLGPVEHVLVVDDGSADPDAVRQAVATSPGPEARSAAPAGGCRFAPVCTEPPGRSAEEVGGRRVAPVGPERRGRFADDVALRRRAGGAFGDGLDRHGADTTTAGGSGTRGLRRRITPGASGRQVLRLEWARGPGGARQVGWEAAATDVVAFVDAGCEPEPGWLAPLTAHLADPAVAAVAPRIRPSSSPSTPRWLAAYERSRSPLDLGLAPAAVRPGSLVPYVPTAALVVRRAALEAVGGFDPHLRFGEDVDLVWRLVGAGWVVRYEPAATVAHATRPNLGALLRQRYDYGCSAAPLAARHGAAVAPVAVPGWSALSWGLVACGFPLLGAGLACARAATLVPRLRRLHHPWLEAGRLAGGGQVAAGRLLAEACRRSWWPVVALACVASRRARRAAVVLTVLYPLLERRPSPRLVSLPVWLALRLAEDLAYGVGVWTGAVRGRSPAALLPASASGRGGRRPGRRPAADAADR